MNASFKGPVGLQLYSLRGIATTNAPAALKQAHDFGFTDVELAGTYKQTPEKFNEMLAANGLRAISGHWSYDLWKKEPEKVIAEAKAVREGAGMFDVSHMRAVDVTGSGASAFLRRLIANDVARLREPGKALYSCMLNEQGGVLDDLIVEGTETVIATLSGFGAHDPAITLDANPAKRTAGIRWFMGSRSPSSPARCVREWPRTPGRASPVFWRRRPSPGR